jgi:hypothetical protein
MARTKQTARKNTDGNSVRKEIAKRASMSPRSEKKLIERNFLCQLERRDLARVIEVGLYASGVCTDRIRNYEYAIRFADGGLDGSVIESDPEHWCSWFTQGHLWPKEMGLSTLKTLKKAAAFGINTSFINNSRNRAFLGKPLPLSVYGGSDSETD